MVTMLGVSAPEREEAAGRAQPPTVVDLQKPDAAVLTRTASASYLGKGGQGSLICRGLHEVGVIKEAGGILS